MNIEVKRSIRRRSIAIQIYPDLRVVVSAPLFYSEKKIESLLKEKETWIQKKIKEFESIKKTQTPRELKEGAVFLVFGKEAKLHVFRSEQLTSQRQSKIDFYEGAFQVMLPAGLSLLEETKLFKKLLEKKYAEIALQKLLERVAFFEPQLKVKSSCVKLRNYRSRWGTCRSNGEITFNWRLAMVPDWVLDYVVVHELSHLRVMSHQPRFWKCVESVYPEHKKARSWLRKSAREAGLFEI